MVDPELIDYIRAQSQQGVPAPMLRESLMEAGWAEHDIENALHDVAAGMRPVTAGASIHEDLAQVRGLVAHLASRVHRLEVRLTAAMPSAGLLEARPGPDETLPAPRSVGGSGIGKAIAAAVFLAAAAWFVEMRVAASDAVPVRLFVSLAALGVLSIVLAYGTMRRGAHATASALTATALGLWALATWHVWNTYHVVSWGIALALGILYLVIALVMGVWIERLARR
jgi:hypothetical protein